MPVVVRRVERRDRDQLTDLVNLHVAAVVPGVVLSVNAVLSQVEREPGEYVVDPWVAERCCLVVERDQRLVAAALLHRFRADADVAEAYRGAGDVRWLVCRVDAEDDGRLLLARVVAVMRAWGVTTVGADCSLPALGCFGVPDTAPHLRTLLADAGFAGPTRREVVLAAPCEHLVRPAGTDGPAGPDGPDGPDGPAGPVVTRTVGTLGTRFDVAHHDRPVGWIEVCLVDAQQARQPLAATWADVGNLVVAKSSDTDEAIPVLLDVAARWLLLGGVTRLVTYWAPDVGSEAELRSLHRAGFTTLVTNERGFVLQLDRA